MTHTTETTVTESTETIVTTGAPATEVVAVVAPKEPKVPSKKSLAMAIFAEKMVERSQGLFASNKEFRAAVLRKIESDLSVSTASAATMYNAAKDEAEKADASVGLGRDPKKVKIVVEGAGKRGRPAGSTNKKKDAEVIVVSDATAALVEAADAAGAELIVAALATETVDVAGVPTAEAVAA